MGRVRLVEESTKSRRGLHVERKIALVIDTSGSVKRPPTVVGEAPKTYSLGEARYLEADLGEGEYAVQVRLVRGLGGHVKGHIIVIDGSGRQVFKAVYRKGKLRRSFGDLRYARIVETAVYSIGLHKYVRRTNWKTGNPFHHEHHGSPRPAHGPP
ncbi:MAG: hypothetical protein LRS43_04955 [Desulfurococcales archaeon]|nr:hypothetical protein [Desulfurococcales archaeon]